MTQPMDISATTAAPRAPVIDVSYFPHLVESIMDASSHDTYLNFRASCKAYKQRADGRLFTRVALLPRAEQGPGTWGILSGSLCTMPSRPSTPISRSPTPPSSISSLSSPSRETAPDTIPAPTALPELSSSPGSSAASSRACTPLPPVYARLPLGPVGSNWGKGEHDTLSLTRVLDLPRDDAPRGDALQPLLWRLEHSRPNLEIIRNAGSRVPRCILPRTQTFVDFAVPWNTYLFRLGSSMFPPAVERVVLHAGRTRHPEAREASLATVFEAMGRSDMPRSVAGVVLVVSGCEAHDEMLVAYARDLYYMAQRAVVDGYLLQVVGLEDALERAEVDEEGRDIAQQLADAVAPYIPNSTRREVINTIGQIIFTSFSDWLARDTPASQLESQFDL